MTITESITKNAQSTVDVDGVATIVASINGTVAENGRINMSVYVQNPELFKDAKESVVADVNTFMRNLYEMEA